MIKTLILKHMSICSHKDEKYKLLIKIVEFISILSENEIKNRKINEINLLL
jgi:hypothetical protein